MRIKKNDMVLVLAGRDKGRRGKVLELLASKDRVRVEGINVVKRHVKAGRDPKAPQGGIIEAPAPIHISNVRLVCGHCNKSTTAKVRQNEGGKRLRFCVNCNESMDKE
jgi:large subunit ribosomal protein L24